MSDSPNPAPAGAGDAPALMTNDDLLKQLESFGDDGQRDDPAPSEEEPEEETEQPEPEADDAPEGDDEAAEEDGSEDEGPADDAAEPEPKEAPEKESQADAKKFRLRDGTEVQLGDLKKGFDRAREFDQVLPKIQREFQEFQQAKQQFEVKKQEFDTLQQSVARRALASLPPEPDPAWMDQNSGHYDPMRFLEDRHKREVAIASFNQEFAGVAQAQQEAAQKAQQEAGQRTQTLRQNAVQQFFGAHPELQAPEKGQAFVRDFHKVADVVGYSREERADVLDPRLYRLTYLAARGLEAMQAGQQQKAVTTQQKSIAAKKVAAAPPVAAPAARQSAASRDARVLQASVERLRKNPSSTEAQLAALAQFD